MSRLISRVINLADDDFKLMGLPARYAIDRTALDTTWRELQSQVHPDRFVSQGAASQRLAMQQSVRVNEAYRRLRDPLKRAAYLCELRGAAIDAERNTAMPQAFLMQQMAWREALDEAHDLMALDALAQDVQRERETLLNAVQTGLDATVETSQGLQHAAQATRSLMFVDKFLSDVHARRDALQP
jgi:molecular chaperone HscB